jgi:phage gpG-like protein
MASFTTKIKSNLNFKHLSNNLGDFIDTIPHEIGGQASKVMMQGLGHGKHQPLADLTKQLRREGVGWRGKKVKPVTEDIPLIQTGTLFRSLRYKKSTNSIDIEKYGLLHHKGFTNDRGLKVPARPFLDIIDDSDTFLHSTLTVGKAVLAFNLKNTIRDLLVGKKINLKKTTFLDI